MNIEVPSKLGVVLKTSGKYCTEDILISPKLNYATITENGKHTPGDGYSGFGDVEVNVQPPLQEKEYEISENGTVELEPEQEYYGISKVSIVANFPVHHAFINAEREEF